MIPSSSSYETVAEVVELSRAVSVSLKGHVLIADGDERHRRSVAAMLREHGYGVLEARDGAAAIVVIREDEPDAAIVDVGLSIQNGFKVIEHIRDPGRVSDKNVWDMPFLMTAATLRGREKQYAIHLGACEYLIKPVSAADLCPRLEHAVRAYRLHRGLPLTP